MSFFTRHIFAAVVVIVVTALSFATGCSEDVTSVLGTDQPYTLYGVLSPQLDSQWVRVYPIEDRLEPAPDERLDAVFTSVDLDSGEEFVWRDSLILDAHNQWAHVFWAPFRAEFGHTYRVNVRRSDGRESSAEARVPLQTEVRVQEPFLTATRVVAPVLIEGDAPRLLRIEVVYSVGYRPAGNPNIDSGEVTILYDGLQEKTPEGWVIPIDLNADLESVIDTVQRRLEGPISRSDGMILNRITLRLIVANEEWNPPGGVFDPEVLVQPGTLSNVENGFGYVVAGYRQGVTFLPPEEIIEAAGFRPSG